MEPTDIVSLMVGIPAIIVYFLGRKPYKPEEDKP